jgi:regulator of protease activity HflC (stomatin/prohibitin superfamily)
MNEVVKRYMNGIPALLVGLILLGGAVWLYIRVTGAADVLFATGVMLLGFFSLAGVFAVNPNEARVLQLFGKYVGTAKEPGLRWANPFYTKTRISTRIRNFETGKLKVNDNTGNPIEIAAVVVWRVTDTAEAKFNVDDYVNFVHVQSEAALRNMATGYAYVSHEDNEKSLSGHTAEISEELKREVHDRLAKAGVNVLETRISHLAYAPEIAAAMLQRQQASAVVAARQKIVEGAVGMVESALEKLSSQHIIELDDERRANMVSNLLVVLCSDRHTQPVINTGSLYN